MRVLNSPSIRWRTRSGFSLTELAIAITLVGVIGIGLMKTIVTTQRVNSIQTQRIDVQQNLRSAAALLPSELRSLDAVDGDIIAMAANGLTIRAMRQFGIICTAPVLGGNLTGVTFTVRTPLYASARNFAVGDSLFIWYEGDAYTRKDDGWIRGVITALVTVNCADGSAGQRLTTTLIIPAPMLNRAGAVPLGAPVRGYEIVVYQVAQAADSRWYLNLTAAGATVSVIGPLSGSSGVTFSFFNANGAVTAVPTQVAQIGIVVREHSVRKTNLAGASGYATDSVSTVVTLRNNPRY